MANYNKQIVKSANVRVLYFCSRLNLYTIENLTEKGIYLHLQKITANNSLDSDFSEPRFRDNKLQSLLMVVPVIVYSEATTLIYLGTC